MKRATDPAIRLGRAGADRARAKARRSKPIPTAARGSFGDLSCATCHNVNGRGGNSAPDWAAWPTGTLRPRRLPPLCGTTRPPCGAP